MEPNRRDVVAPAEKGDPMKSRLLSDTLHQVVQGQVITPGDAAYDSARQVWNAMIEGGRRSSSAVRSRQTFRT